MARVTITISDEEDDQALSVGMEFSPAIKLADGRDTNSKQFMEDNPDTHVAAYLAFAAINEYMDTDPEVHAFSHSHIVI
jgi:hypothetical protein